MTSTQAVIVHPNQFVLHGYDIRITFSTTSITGTPRLSFTRREQTQNFSGAEIQEESTRLGRVVTVSLNAASAGAGLSETLSLFIPAVSLPVETKESPVQTVAIFSLKAAVKQGPTQSYLTVCLSGTAQQLDF